jgi:transposase
MGRPSKLTPELADAIVTRIRDGNFPEVAAQCEGIHRSTYYGWMQRGEAEEEGAYRDFFDSVARAEAEFEAGELERVRKSFDKDGNPAHARWLLERRQRERWGQSIDVRVRNDAIDAVLGRLRAGLDPATFARCLELLADGEGEG